MTRDNLATATKLITVEIDGSGIEVGRTYTDKKDGTTKPLRGRQTGYIWQGARYPIKVAIEVPDGKAPYAPGTYLISGELFATGDFDRLTFKGTRDMHLIPLDVAIEALIAVHQEETGEVIDFPAPAKTGTK